MKTYFVASDLHGKYTAFIFALLEKGFEIDNPNHIIILAGDSFDRGNQNKEIYDFIQKMGKRILNVKGNHDQFLIDFLEGKDNGEFNTQHNGLYETLRDLAELTDKEMKEKTLQQVRFIILNKRDGIIDFLKNFVDGYKLDNYIITHAGFSENAFNGKFYADNWANTPAFIRKFRDRKLFEQYTFVFGHWHAFRLTGDFLLKKDIESNTFIYRNFIGLDACSNYTNRVNILVVETDTEPQPFGGSIDLSMLEDF
jgi:serine/threonine protein phosphatase 1